MNDHYVMVRLMIHHWLLFISYVIDSSRADEPDRKARTRGMLVQRPLPAVPTFPPILKFKLLYYKNIYRSTNNKFCFVSFGRHCVVLFCCFEVKAVYFGQLLITLKIARCPFDPPCALKKYLYQTLVSFSHIIQLSRYECAKLNRKY